MFKIKQLRPFFMATLLLALFSCNNQNVGTSDNVVVDSVVAQAPDSSIVPSDTTMAQIVEEGEIDDEPDDVRDYDWYGIYVGSDLNNKFEFDRGVFQYFEGSQVKMKGTLVLWDPEPNPMVMGLIPYGKNKKSIEIRMGLAEFDIAKWIVFEGDTFFRKTSDVVHN